MAEYDGALAQPPRHRRRQPGGFSSSIAGIRRRVKWRAKRMRDLPCAFAGFGCFSKSYIAFSPICLKIGKPSAKGDSYRILRERQKARCS